MKYSTKGITPKAEEYPDLLSCDQLALWQVVLGNYHNLYQRFCNPYRHDTNPGCYLFEGRDGIVRISDFASPLTGKDVISFAAAVWNLHPLQAVWRITEGKVLKHISTSEAVLRKHETIMEWKLCKWREADRLYWQAYGISKAQLEAEKTYAVSKIWLNKRFTREMYPIICKAPASVTILGDKGKVYRPSNAQRFFSTIPPGTLMGAKGNRDRDRVIITKFVKDKLVINNAGFDSLYLNGENDMLSEEDIHMLNRNYAQVFHLTDADQAGMRIAQHLSDTYAGRVAAVAMPSMPGCTDPSDVLIKHSQSDLKYLLSNL